MESTQMNQLREVFVSRASAEQRRGRAGRVRAGVCFRLYTRAVYEAFPRYSVPEILRIPLEELCLHIMACLLYLIYISWLVCSILSTYHGCLLYLIYISWLVCTILSTYHGLFALSYLHIMVCLLYLIYISSLVCSILSTYHGLFALSYIMLCTILSTYLGLLLTYLGLIALS